VSERVVIGIATQTQEPVRGETPLAWVMGQKYVRVLTDLGAVPWLIPLLPGDEATLREIYDRIDGVFLTGGVDVDPGAYHEARHELCGRTDPARDWTEVRLVRWAIEDKKPVLGVCRGIQIINVACGGTLYQDVKLRQPMPIKHDYFPSQEAGYARDLLVHDVDVQQQSRLRQIMGDDHVRVNSMHHQSIKDLAPGLVATAFAPDGMIEGVECTEGIECRNGHFLLGIQWHPEELVDTAPSMRQLFQAFLTAVRDYRAQPLPR
jgi:putative glutamine amidotransferase